MTTRFSIADQPVFPHIKLTREDFPRALATRIVKDDGDEYFGAFLNRTSVRILIDFLNRTFRLRSCTIDIDGSFEVPCTQYYAKRCVAPCVTSLCDREQYLAMVELVRLFLQNGREALLAALGQRIERASDALDFETAAFYRDVFQDVERFYSQPRWQVWLDDTVDTFELYADDDAVYLIVISQRGRRALGEVVYAFAALDEPTQVLADVVPQFYRFHLPREIRVSHDFEGRLAVAEDLSNRFGREIRINVVGSANRRITAERAIAATKARVELERSKRHLTSAELQAALRNKFELAKRPRRIEAFDVAHISATGFAAAVSVWEDGHDRPDEYEHSVSDHGGELDTLRRFVRDRVRRTDPDLLVIDGGRSHLKAAHRAIEDQPRRPDVIAVVKPKGKHASISHFFTGNRRVEFQQDDPSQQLLQRLRNDAHDLANATHRLGRDMMHFYELAAILPSLDERERQQLLRELGSIRKIVALDANEFEKRFGKTTGNSAAADLERFREGRSPKAQALIVPIRFVETDGAAEDLIPMEMR